MGNPIEIGCVKQQSKQEIDYTPKPVIKSVSRPLVTMETNGTLILTEDFLKKVKYLCNKISTKEWSGILFYKEEGTIENPETIKCTPIDIFLMDIGTSGSTSYNIGPDIIEAYDNNPELENCMLAHIHSHNTMGK